MLAVCFTGLSTSLALTSTGTGTGDSSPLCGVSVSEGERAAGDLKSKYRPELQSGEEEEKAEPANGAIALKTMRSLTMGCPHCAHVWQQPGCNHCRGTHRFRHQESCSHIEHTLPSWSPRGAGVTEPGQNKSQDGLSGPDKASQVSFVRDFHICRNAVIPLQSCVASQIIQFLRRTLH